MIVPKSVYPPGTSCVRTDKNLYLLHSRYSRNTDTLRILYKDINTGKKFLDEIKNPVRPMWVAKQMPNFFVDYIHYKNVYPVVVHEKTKSREIQNKLFPKKSWTFTDPITGLTQYRDKLLIGDDIARKKVEMLHPQLFGADVPIEHLVSMEYCVHKYHEVGDGIKMEVIPQPKKITRAAFDIETSLMDNGSPYINLNTFIDKETMTAYAYYLKSDKYPNQDALEDAEEFSKYVKSCIQWSMDNMSTVGAPKKRIRKVKELVTKYINELKIVCRGFDTESELIYEASHLMFTEHKPDLLMAFNTAYDASVFQRRITELNLPAGTFNCHDKKEWINTPPPLAEDLNDRWELRYDTIDPKKRMTSFDNIALTEIVDLANAYYSNRKGDTFSAMSLDQTAKRELHLGKLDYSHLCNHVLKLPFACFKTHTAYGLIDSLLVLLIEEITQDFDSKLSYISRTKSDMRTTASNNQAISRAYFADSFYMGKLKSNNWRKYLWKFNRGELKKIQEVTNIDYCKIVDLNLRLPGRNKGEIKGGIVGNPAKLKSPFNVYRTEYHILNAEVMLTRFKKFNFCDYIDAKSHYPCAIGSRNICIESYYGDIVTIQRYTGEIIKTARWCDKGKPEYIEHLGGINLSIVNNDPITYGNRTMNLPSMSELASHEVAFDSKPKFEPTKYLSGSYPLKDFKAEEKIMQVLATINDEKLSASEVKNGMIKNTGYFFLNNGNQRYQGSYLKYDFHGNDIASKIIPGIKEPVFGIRGNGMFNVDNSKLVMSEIKPPEFTGPYTVISLDTMLLLGDATTFTHKMRFDGEIAYVPRFQVAYPYKYVCDKQIPKNYISAPDKHVIVSTPRYRMFKREATFATELSYDIVYKDYKITVTQITDWVSLNAKIEEIKQRELKAS